MMSLRINFLDLVLPLLVIKLHLSFSVDHVSISLLKIKLYWCVQPLDHLHQTFHLLVCPTPGPPSPDLSPIGVSNPWTTFTRPFTYWCVQPLDQLHKDFHLLVCPTPGPPSPDLSPIGVSNPWTTFTRTFTYWCVQPLDHLHQTFHLLVCPTPGPPSQGLSPIGLGGGGGAVALR